MEVRVSTELSALDATESALLVSYEEVIRQGLESFVEVGNALAAIRDRELWRGGFGSFKEYCAARWGFSEVHTYRLLKANEVMADVATNPGVSPTSEKQIRPLAKIEKDRRAEVWQEVVDTAPKDDDGEPKITAKHVEQVVAKALDKPHVSNNSGNNEWYTPPEYLESARKVLGAIDCDPASCSTANRNVKAKRFFTAEDSGLDAPRWGKRVWMNPPYAQPLCGLFCEELKKRCQSGEVDEAIVLVNNATETEWFRALTSAASAVVFPAGRIKFLDSENNPRNTPLQGQCFVYFGTRFSVFLEEFGNYGWGAIVQ
jgi:ParB family chromosome partitioning protein